MIVETYKERPVTVKAVQIDEYTDLTQLIFFTGATSITRDSKGHVNVLIDNAGMKISNNDYVIKYPNGDIYFVKPDKFKEAFQKEITYMDD